MIAYKFSGYSFNFSGPVEFRRFCHPGDELTFSGHIMNTGLRRGSVYVRVVVFDPYDTDRIVFDTDIHLSENDRSRLRRKEILPLHREGFACVWKVPSNLRPGPYYTILELWTPSRILAPESKTHPPFRFTQSCRYGSPEVVPPRPEFKLEARKKVFVSYSSDNTNHTRWVFEFVDMLTQAGIEVVIDRYRFLPGDQLREDLFHDCDYFDFIIPVCSLDYTKKADALLQDGTAKSGVKIETEVFSSPDFFSRVKKRFIPVTRDNPSDGINKLPLYLRNIEIIYENMDRLDWKGEPLERIVQRIINIRTDIN